MNKTTRKSKQKSKIPALSVIMPVYNAEKYIDQAIRSVLAQSYRDFELIIVDDNSNDASWKIIQKYQRRNKRIIAFQNDRRIGLAATLKRQIALVRADFIARMDATDIALPERFLLQMKFLSENPKVVACGGQCLVINEKGKITGEKKLPTEFDEIYQNMLKFSPAIQPTIMIARKRLPWDFEYYKETIFEGLDLDFLFRIFKYGRVQNLPDYLLLQRQIDKNLTLIELKKGHFYTFLTQVTGILAHGYKPNAASASYAVFTLLLTIFLPRRSQSIIGKYIKTGSQISPVSRKILRKYSYLGVL